MLGPPSYGIGATIRIGREMLCLPYAGFLYNFTKEYIYMRRLQTQTLLDETPPVSKMNLFSKIAVTFEPI